MWRKFNLRGIVHLTVKAETINLSEEHVEKYLTGAPGGLSC